MEDLVGAIRRLAVRGAPALGGAGALGVALAVRQYPIDPTAPVAALRAARPTAVNLARGVDRAAARLAVGPDAVLTEALRLRGEEIASSSVQARLGADLVTAPPDRS